MIQTVHSRSALSVWLCNLDLCKWDNETPPGMLSADDVMMGWIVSSVGNGSTPGEVLLWIFPSFGGHLFDLVKDGSGSM